VALAFSVPAVVLEPAGPFEAMSISWERTKGHRLNIFLVILVGGAALFGMGMIGAIGQFVLARLGTPGMVVSTVIQQGLSGLGGAFFLVLLVLGYLRLSGRWLPGSPGSTVND
jgi:membrane-anchored glycerophosphoryl diester phosphodiesterase (GDPDase)